MRQKKNQNELYNVIADVDEQQWWSLFHRILTCEQKPRRKEFIIKATRNK